MTNYINSITKAINIEKTLLMICVAIMGVVSANRMVYLLQSFSIGKLLQSIGFVIPFLIIILFIKYLNVKDLFFLFRGLKKTLKLRWLFGLVCLGWVLTPMILWAGASVSITYSLITCIILSLFIYSLMLGIKERTLEAVIIMLLTFPLVKFIEYNFQGTFVERFDLGFIIITPRIIWLFCLLFISILNTKGLLSFFQFQKMPLILIASFGGWAIFSCLMSKNPVYSFNGTFLEIICPFMFFFLILGTIKSIKDIYIVIALMIGYLLITTLEGMYFFYQQYGFIFGKDFFYQQNFGLFNIYRMAGNSVMAVMLLLTFWNKKYYRFRPIIVLLISFFVAIIILSQTRTAIFSLFISFVCFTGLMIINNNKNEIKKIFLVGAVATCVIIFLNLQSGFNFQRIGEVIKSGLFFKDNDRTTAWIGTIKIIKDYPLFGIGYNMWNEYVASYMPPTSWFTLPYKHMGYILNPHNLYLSIAVFFGLPTLILFFLSISIIMLKAFKIICQKRENLYRNVTVCALVALIAYLSGGVGGEEHYFTTDNIESGMFLDFSKGFMFFLLIAVILKIDTFLKDKGINKRLIAKTTNCFFQT